MEGTGTLEDQLEATKQKSAEVMAQKGKTHEKSRFMHDQLSSAFSQNE